MTRFGVARAKVTARDNGEVLADGVSVLVVARRLHVGREVWDGDVSDARRVGRRSWEVDVAGRTLLVEDARKGCGCGR